MEQSNVNPYAAPGSDVRDGAAESYSKVTPFSVSGRLGRVRYMGYLMALLLVVWLGGVLLGVLSALFVHAPKGAASPALIVVMGIFFLATTVGAFILAIQRIHDFNASGWLSLLLLVPIVNGIFGLALWFIPGTDGPNRYGAKTPPNGVGITIMAVLVPLFMVAYVGMLSAIAIPAYQQYVKKAHEMQMQPPR